MGRTSGRASDEAELVAGLVHKFLDEYAPSRTQSGHTLRSYRTALVLYLRYLESLGVTTANLSRTDFERARIEGWMAWLRRERGNSNDTCNNRLGSIRAFLDYAGSREPGMLYLSAEASKIKRLASDGAKVEGMSRAAVQAMLAAPDTSTPIGRRDLTFLTVMYSTACRLDEVRSLTAGQVRLGGGRPHVIVHGKGNKTRTCYLLPKAASVLRAYMLETMGPRPDPDSLLFPSSHNGGVMCEEAWAKRVKIHARKARETCPEVPEDAHCHQLRHAKASHWIEDGMNVVEVQFLLGHAQLSTTMRYVDVAVGQKAEGLQTIGSESDAGQEKKWMTADGSLAGFCGIGRR